MTISNGDVSFGFCSLVTFFNRLSHSAGSVNARFFAAKRKQICGKIENVFAYFYRVSDLFFVSQTAFHR